MQQLAVVLGIKPLAGMLWSQEVMITLREELPLLLLVVRPMMPGERIRWSQVGDRTLHRGIWPLLLVALVTQHLDTSLLLLGGSAIKLLAVMQPFQAVPRIWPQDG